MSEKNKGGRPPKYKTVEEIKVIIERYFGDSEKEESIPNKAGLRVALGICRDTYCDWKKLKHKFSYTLKETESRIEEAWVKRLGKTACTGAIFYLKNAFAEDYKDRHETDITSGGKPIYLPDVLIKKNETPRSSKSDSS